MPITVKGFRYRLDWSALRGDFEQGSFVARPGRVYVTVELTLTNVGTRRPEAPDLFNGSRPVAIDVRERLDRGCAPFGRHPVWCKDVSTFCSKARDDDIDGTLPIGGKVVLECPLLVEFPERDVAANVRAYYDFAGGGYLPEPPYEAPPN